jgi:hypothetical protein
VSKPDSFERRVKKMETRETGKGIFIILIGAILVLSILSLTVFADIPNKINYQGYLTDSGGTPINGPVSMQFSIYDTPTGGSVLWTETQSVAVNNGIYSINLGEVTPITLAFDAQYYLGVTVGTDPEMTPRRSLTNVPYAFRAKTAEKDHDTLAFLNCSIEQVSKWNGSAWVCANDEVGGGGLAPSSTVSTLDGAPSAGTSSEYSRGDHKHGIGAGAIKSVHIQENTITNANISPTAAIDGSKLASDGSVIKSLVSGTNISSVVNNSDGSWTINAVGGGGGGDNLGNHIATQNIQLNGRWLSGDGGDEGVYVNNAGNVGVGTSSPSERLEVNGNLKMIGEIKTDRWLNSDSNTFIGVGVAGAGALAHTGGEEGWYNTAVGTGSLYHNTTGYRNSALGGGTLYYNTTGSRNSAVGEGALLENTTGFNNSAMGMSALLLNTEGSQNTAIGSYALNHNATGFSNSAVGNRALIANTTGHYNSAVGADALNRQTTGGHNTALGANAGYNNTTGSNNVFLGESAGYNEMGSSRLHIANSSSNTLVYGEFNNGKVCINCTDPATGLDVNGQLTVRSWASASATAVCKNGNTLSTCSSSLQHKEKIQDLEMGLETVEMLRPVTFKWKDRREYDLGFIAEEVAEIAPILVTYNREGEVEGVRYMQLTALLVKAIQGLKVENEVLRQRLSALEGRVSASK